MNIANYWIEQIKETKEFKALAETEDTEVIKLQQAIEDLLDNEFIESATEWGIARREKLLSITPFADDTLNDRRFRVLSRWNNKIPYTFRNLVAKLNQMCGKDGYELQLNHNEYSLEIKVELKTKRMLQEVDSLAHIMCPCNLLISVRLKYNKHYILAEDTHRQLQVYSHTGLREEVL